MFCANMYALYTRMCLSYACVFAACFCGCGCCSCCIDDDNDDEGPWLAVVYYAFVHLSRFFPTLLALYRGAAQGESVVLVVVVAA